LSSWRRQKIRIEANRSFAAAAMRWGYLRRLLLVSACIFLLYAAHSTHAQGWAYRSSVDNRLNSDDLDALTAAARHLLDRPQLAEGGFETWSNPRSGVSGTVVAGKPLSRSGMDCRVLNFFTHVPGPNADRNRVFTWCKTKDGWKIAG
jgi:hypothetical protein